MDSTTATHHLDATPPRLTRELVALAARDVQDTGPAPGVAVHNDTDYEASLQSLLAAGGWQGGRVGLRLWLAPMERCL